MFEQMTFQEAPTWHETDFVVKITQASQYGARWWYAATEQILQPAVSQASDSSAAPLYQDHPFARTFFLPGTTGGPFLTEINSRQLNVGDLVRCRHKTETPAGTVFECEATDTSKVLAIFAGNNSVFPVNAGLYATLLNLTVPAGVWYVVCKVTGHFTNGNTAATNAWMYAVLSTSAGTLTADGSVVLHNPALAINTELYGTTVLQNVLTTTVPATITLQMQATSTNSNCICQMTNQSTGGGSSIAALQIAGGGGSGGGSGLVVGTTTISGGGPGNQLYDAGGVLGEISSVISGTFGG